MANEPKQVKQVVLARKDLAMSPGKLAAQVAHASLGVLLSRMEWTTPITSEYKVGDILIVPGGAFDQWITGSFTKVVLAVNSQEELLGLYELADKEGLPCFLVLDAGRTEFSGPTYTCVAIGPEFSEQLDKITGHLKLY